MSQLWLTLHETLKTVSTPDLRWKEPPLTLQSIRTSRIIRDNVTTVHNLPIVARFLSKLNLFSARVPDAAVTPELELYVPTKRRRINELVCAVLRCQSRYNALRFFPLRQRAESVQVTMARVGFIHCFFAVSRADSVHRSESLVSRADSAHRSEAAKREFESSYALRYFVLLI